MTQEVLIQVIFVLCNGTTADLPGKLDKDYQARDAKERRIDCMETYVNCAVGPGGKIMELKEFMNKCKGK